MRHLIDKLKRHGTLDQEMKETMSMDWRAEQTLLIDMFQTVSKQRSWIPRVAELVLFVKDIDGEICFDAAAKDYKIFKEFQGDGIFTGHPQWQAGVIGQVANESLQLEDLLLETSKTENVTYSGFRVEPFPEPNNHKDKAFSKQYKYVPLHHIRPFVLWQEFVKGTSQTEWHPTIKNALTVMSSMSLLEKHHFRGTWPNATILCRGIYIGSELICVGDTVRIIPAADWGKVTDIIRVDAIKFRLSNLDKASENDNDDGHPYNSSVSIVGKAHTLDLNRAWSKTPISRFDTSRAIPTGMDGYGEWHLLHDPSKQYQISFTRVLGRCIEADPMLLWFPTTETEDPKADLSKGLEGVRAARRFSSTNDTRILEGKSWFWGDCRAETLDIEELNGVRVSAYDDDRNENELELWRKSIRVMDKTAGVEEKMALTQAITPVNRPSKMLGGHQKTEMNTETGLATEDATPMSDSGVETDPLQAFKMGEMQNARKRSHSAADVGASPSASSSRGGTSEESQDLLSTMGMVKPVVILGTGRLQSQSTPGREREDSASKKPRVVIEIDA